MRRSVASSLLIFWAAAQMVAQMRPPERGRNLPNPGPNRIEVRFALGKSSLKCEYFHIEAVVEGRIIFSNRFSSGFLVPPAARDLPRNDALALNLTCGSHRWHFTKVPETVFEASWWWVGTDFPPFQETFQGWPEFEDSTWIRYLIVDPQGFFVERHCPVELKKQKPGPCFAE
jgi:hypothetical protein